MSGFSENIFIGVSDIERPICVVLFIIIVAIVGVIIIDVLATEVVPSVVDVFCIVDSTMVVSEKILIGVSEIERPVCGVPLVTVVAVGVIIIDV